MFDATGVSVVPQPASHVWISLYEGMFCIVNCCEKSGTVNDQEEVAYRTSLQREQQVKMCADDAPSLVKVDQSDVGAPALGVTELDSLSLTKVPLTIVTGMYYNQLLYER